MVHEIKYNFDTSNLVSTSPFSKSAIIEMYETMQQLCHTSLNSNELRSGDITVEYSDYSSGYSLDEFKAHFSNSSKYTRISFNFTTSSGFDLIFFISPATIFLLLRSSFFTKPQLEDLRDDIVIAIQPLIEKGKCLEPIHTDLKNSLDYLYEKVHTLPIVDNAGNPIEVSNISEKHNETNSANPPNEKTPFYKSGVFWGAAGSFATIATLIAGILGWV